jgi:hypothetical protein
MADVDINKRLVFIKDTTKQVALPPNTATPGNPITPAVEVDFLSLTDTPDSYDGRAEAFAIVNEDEDGIELKKVSEFDTKATPIAADKIAIIDSEDGDLLKVVEIGDLPGGGGGDTVEGDEDRGIEVTEPTPGTKVVNQKYKNTFITVGASVAITLSEGRRHILSVANDFDLLNPTNIADYEGPVEIIITQGLGGDHQISTVGDKIIFPNNVIPTLSGVFGESDWLRGIAANGYLLIYQIENLAAPDIDIPPPEPPIAADNYLFLYDFDQINPAITSPGSYRRSQDSSAQNFVYLSGKTNADDVHAFLKASTPISDRAEFISTNHVWNDQSGNGLNVDDAGGKSLTIIADNNKGNFGLLSLNSVNAMQAIVAPVVSGIGQMTFFAVIDWRGSVGTNNQSIIHLEQTNEGTRFFEFYIPTTPTIQCRARSVGTDALTTITGFELQENKKYLLEARVNWAGGTFSFYINGALIGTASMASSANLPTGANWRLSFVRLQVNIGIYAVYGHPSIAGPICEEIGNYLMARKRTVNITTQLNGNNIAFLFDLIINLDRYNYSPYAANVRESGGNTELVISHDNTTGLFDVTAFNAHIGANQGFASRMINQKRPTQVLTQTTAARQLRIIPNHFGTNRAAFLGDNAARRSIQGTFAINTKALHYYWFMAVEIISTPTNPTFFSITASGNAIMALLYFESGGKPRLRTLTRRLSGDTSRTTSSSTDLEYATKYLVSCHFDYQNGIINVWANGTQVINDTGGFSGTSVAAANLLTIGNFADNNANGGVNAYLTAPFLVQGLISTAQREAIEAYLMDNYGI